MSKESQILLILSSLLLIFPIAGQSATIDVYASCAGGTYQLSQPGSLSCTGTTTIPPGYLSTAHASLFVDLSAKSIAAMTDASDQAMSHATYTATLQITIAGGSGSGLYIPCLTAGASGIGSFATAQFGSITPLSGSCTTFDGSKVIAFAYGVAQTQLVTISAYDSNMLNGGGALASLNGIQVFDSSRNLVTTAQVALVDTAATSSPEPRMLVPLGLILGLGWLLRRRTS
jgi:hypothetical protein